ncbi:Hypothetical protein LCAKO_2198 [Lacticaseibacillus paracasei subsp. paracasei]|uniref:Uncharacterized protein n=1 Tax=Lacticaseibacillus paracasei subsp. paracasei TaxID=47714 RepID=A0AAP9KW15_LACPA|nr:Hypothetical protein LCAKO_2198 [Lacticaseibacillus paracasei subsp. paracasei]
MGSLMLIMDFTEKLNNAQIFLVHYDNLFALKSFSSPLFGTSERSMKF